MSKPPEGTRPWRKAWRKRWREDSTFREIGPLAKLIVIWVEDNADDDGSVLTTVRQLAQALGGHHYKQRIPRMTLWRAWKEAEEAGLLVTQAGQHCTAERDSTPSRITRVNFKAYQEQPETSGTASGTALVTDAGHSSRGLQKKITTPRDPVQAAVMGAARSLCDRLDKPFDPAAAATVKRNLKAGMPPGDLLWRLERGLTKANFVGAAFQPWAQEGSIMTGERDVECRRSWKAWADANARNGNPVGAGRGGDVLGAAGEGGSSPRQPGLPALGADHAESSLPVRRPRRTAGHVQDDGGVELGGEHGDGGASGALDRPRHAGLGDGGLVPVEADGDHAAPAGGLRARDFNALFLRAIAVERSRNAVGLAPDGDVVEVLNHSTGA